MNQNRAESFILTTRKIYREAITTTIRGHYIETVRNAAGRHDLMVTHGNEVCPDTVIPNDFSPARIFALTGIAA